MHTRDIVVPNNNENGGVAPFVMKTYLMVSDPATDHIVAWSRANNSFIVADPLEFSTFLLPLNFKHNNFSSFVRQLNTYGFKKVDPDRWEFANEWFLRGQKHLLKNIVRRKHSPSHHQQIVLRRGGGGGEAAEEGEMVREIERMKKEQSEMEKELEEMTRRLEATERRPDQMAAFLCRVVEDPAVLDRIVIERERICNGEEERKRRRIMASPASGSGRTEEEEWSSSVGAASSSPEVNCRSSQSTEDFGGGMEELVAVGCGNGGSAVVDGFCGGGNGGFGGVPVVGWGVEAEVETKPPPYPFSLFSGGI